MKDTGDNMKCFQGKRNKDTNVGEEENIKQGRKQKRQQIQFVDSVREGLIGIYWYGRAGDLVARCL